MGESNNITTAVGENIEKAAGNDFGKKAGIVALGVLAIYGTYKGTVEIVKSIKGAVKLAKKIKEKKAAEIEESSEEVEVETIED